ncbi:ATP-binding cassette domain-containing protein [Spirulina subsalsa FACHB-351]|uniref:ATP-binding cassette domain-containing protein n=1 Tax=Spirulina subsalsa FACHB-351 TaxID=234711 RepID=A0ABT3KZZ6_9CYAN|nr:oligopeptide/dipeptide ABC transporter ATP-binding protein [Spirulina subsalsa]MCW6034826.1 ATP-binding cassette domain-containing protein [Spirulina subsalsa FACHB-351]
MELAPLAPIPKTARTLIKVENLQVHFPLYQGGIFSRQMGVLKAVDNVNFTIYQGETLGLVGESGCGKSTTGRAILQLQAPTGGQVYFEERELTQLSGENLRQMRRQMQMIFQDPYASLNPRMTVGDIVAEPLAIYDLAQGQGKMARVRELLDIVGLNPSFIHRYPHEFSGGQRQRIAIARALALNPAFIVCDEPIAALDVSIQAQIINLMQALQREFNLTYLFIAHDLSVVRHISDRVAVMYLGKIVELADHRTLYETPQHPYTQALLSAVPIPDPDLEAQRQRIILTGDVPSPLNPPPGCNFQTRCPYATERCGQAPEPEFREIAPGHFVACHLV